VVPQQPIELILLRQWASYIETPVWIMDGDGDLVFYNEAAEPILGRRFDEVGAINAAELAELFTTTNTDGSPMNNRDLPVVVALLDGVPAHGRIRIRTLDHAWREIEVTALPINGQGGRHLGAMAMFWEPEN
jgi:PAS domain-containing protein